MRRLVLLLALGACAEDPATPRPPVRQPGEPRRVLIDRIFITYRGNPFGVEARRTIEEARRLARRLFERARAGESFEELCDGYSDDRGPAAERGNCRYILLNYGTAFGPTLSHMPRLVRENMGARLGDVAFGMKAGDIALIEYDEKAYPAGFEIIRCVRRDDRTEEQVAVDLARERKDKKD